MVVVVQSLLVLKGKEKQEPADKNTSLSLARERGGAAMTFRHVRWLLALHYSPPLHKWPFIIQVKDTSSDEFRFPLHQ